MLLQVFYGAVVGVRYMRQRHPVDSPFMQRTNYLQLVVRLIRGISKEKKVTATGTFGLHAAHHLTKINVSDGRQGDPDSTGSRLSQRTSQDIGDESQLVNRLIDCL